MFGAKASPRDPIWDDDPFATDNLMQVNNRFATITDDDAYEDYINPDTRRRDTTQAPQLFKYLDNHRDLAGGPLDNEPELVHLAMNHGTSPDLAKQYNAAGRSERELIARSVGTALQWGATATPAQLATQRKAAEKVNAYKLARKAPAFGVDYTDFGGLSAYEADEFFNATPEAKQAIAGKLNAEMQPWRGPYAPSIHDTPAPGAEAGIKQGASANAADTDYPWQEASITAEANGWAASQVPSINTQQREYLGSGGSVTNVATNQQHPSVYKTDLEIEQEKYENETPWWQYVYDRVATGTLRLGAGVDAMDVLSTAKVLEGYTAVDNKTFTKMDLRSGGHQPSARQSHLRRYFHANKEERNDMRLEQNEELADAVNGAWQLKARADAIPSSPVARAALGASSIGDFWKHFKLDPMAVIGHVVLERAPTEALNSFGAAAGGLLAGPAGIIAGRSIAAGLPE
ncbi:MAG: hypothetical protein H8E30_03710, partial [Alphaproteobacteria bacterium]|nr:hypothetical protein [Alphaproteobacteria bacterium]